MLVENKRYRKCWSLNKQTVCAIRQFPGIQKFLLCWRAASENPLFTNMK